MRNNFRRITGIILLTTATALFIISGALRASTAASPATIEKNAAANSSVLAATFTVTKTADTADGACNSDCSLREAIAAAANGDTIVFDATAFAGTQIVELSGGELVVDKNLLVEGTSASRLTIRRSATAANFRIFKINAGRALTIGKMTISGGVSEGGGGIFIDSGATLNLSNAVVQGNSAGSGGGILVSLNAALNLNNVVIRENASTAVNGGGGGILCNFGTINVNKSSLLQNSAVYRGGALYSATDDVPAVITNSIIKNNAAGERGGGAYITGGAPFTITNSTIDSNVAGHSAGISVNSVSGVIGNSVVSRNQCQAESCNGGGIGNNAGANQIVSLTVFNSTIANNAGIYGGGIYNFGTLLLINSTIAYNSPNGGDGLSNTAGVARLRNTLIANNGGAGGIDVDGAVVSLGNNLIGNAAGSEGFGTAQNDILNPAGGAGLYQSLANNGGATETIALYATSPAINAGNDCVRTQSCPGLNLTAPLTADQRSFNRSGTTDIGAFEFAPASGVLTVTKTADTNDGTCDADCSLREAISAAAQTGAVIEFASPLFDSPQTITLADVSALRTILIEGKHLTINGRGAQMLTVRREAAATRRFRLFDITNSVVTLKGLTLTGGDADGDGAGVRLSAGTLNVNDCHLTGNTSRNGRGAAIFSFNNSVVNLTNSTVSGNTANSSNAGGGGIHNESALNVTNSTVSGNAKTGGANNGGGIWTSGMTTITNSTVADNQANETMSAGGVYASGATTVGNSIIARNLENEDPLDVLTPNNSFTSQGYNLIGYPGATTAFNQAGDQTGEIAEYEGEIYVTPLEPELEALALNGGTTPTHALLPESPAIDKGKSFNSAIDQRGQPRPFDRPNLSPAAGGDHADIGAFEAQALPNIAPQVRASPSPIIVNEDTPQQIKIYASDINADTLTFALVDQPDHGTIGGFDTTPDCVIEYNASDCDSFITYTPNSNFVGEDSFSVKANDGRLDSEVLIVNVTVQNVPQTFTVTKTADTADSACNADCSLREAITAAGNGDTITFASPLFDSPQTIVLAQDAGFQTLVINKNLTIAGNGAQLLKIRRAANATADFRIFQIENGATVKLGGMTIAGGKIQQNGSGIAAYNNTALTLENCHVTENRTINGDGAIISFGALTLDRTAVTNNVSTDDSGTPGIFHTGGTLTVRNSTVSGNVASGETSNYFGGGAIFALNSTVLVVNSTITDNRVANAAGGISSVSGSQVTVRNSIIAGNRNNSSIPDVASQNGTFASEGYNLIGNAGTAAGFNHPTDLTGSPNTIINPNLAALGNYGGTTPTHKLLAGSPAIDAGNSFGALIDQRGMIRPFDITNVANTSDASDIGAFELQPPQSFSIGGTVIYGTTPINQPIKNVSGVSLSASGASAVTNSSGSYLLEDLIEGGNYTVTASKTGDINGITAVDATLVLRCVAAISNCTLTVNQQTAGDANGNGSLSAIDATMILRYVAATGQIEQGRVGKWKFLPASRNYPSLSGSIASDNYAAFLIGDVSGDWTAPTGNLAADDNQKQMRRKTKLFP